MGKHHQATISTFSLTGQFLGFQLEDGYKLKRLQLATATGEESIKLSKESRAGLLAQGIILQPGDWIQVWGEQKLDREAGLAKLKAYRITPAQPQDKTATIAPLTSATPVLPRSTAKPTPTTQTTTVLVCRKSDCMKQGGRSLCQALEAAISKHGLEETVTIKETGCMKNCKAGPNLVFMPNKAKYSRVRPEQVEALVAEHVLTTCGSHKS